eukprot:1673973-Lingulodinium_polyedra.AAC.1
MGMPLIAVLQEGLLALGQRRDTVNGLRLRQRRKLALEDPPRGDLALRGALRNCLADGPTHTIAQI